MTRFIVIGDIHGNHRALKSALEACERIGYDQRIFIGDLLTYGVNVIDIVEQISAASQLPNTVVLRGNHDYIYDEFLLKKVSPYKEGLPEWLQNSIDITASQLDPTIWFKINFQNAYVSHGVFFSHANPFGALNWRYLNSIEDLQEASDALDALNCHVGVFGHTHRMTLFQSQLRSLPITRETAFFVDISRGPLSPTILNCGSIGQPRDRLNREHILVIEKDHLGFHFWFEPIGYDIEAHITDIRKSSLTPEAKDRICKYHRQ